MFILDTHYFYKHVLLVVDSHRYKKNNLKTIKNLQNICKNVQNIPYNICNYKQER